ncbi:MAG: conjugative transposon protein TraN [Paludibacteraceae bacterium]|nr:conjugative transposon protein TraN [Paludibacteraceae bacterium]
MKGIFNKLTQVLVVVFLSISIADGAAQSSIKPISLRMNDVKYLLLAFPSEIKYADLGTGDVIASKSIHGNILKIKAGIPYFDKTNISVVTTDGKYFSFAVEYDANPPYLAIAMKNVKDSISQADVIEPTHIEVSDMNTTHLIFPSKVDEICLGSDNLISEKAEKIDNIVKVKSTIDNPDEFLQSSITVVTDNGVIYPMTVNYNKSPKEMSISFGDQRNKAFFQGVNVNDESMEKMAKWIIEQGMKINSIGSQDFKMTFQLNSIYTDQDVIAFNLHMINNSKIDYGIDFVKAYIQDKKITKKTAMQEDEIYPIYVYYSDPSKVVKGKSDYTVVLFYKKFTIPEKRILFFEMFEANGGRHIKFSAPNKCIIKADVINNN